MQSLHDQVEEAERRHSAVEEQVSCLNMFHCTVNPCNTVFLSKQSQCIYSVWKRSECIDEDNHFDLKRK